MNKRATETTLINTLVDSMSVEDLLDYVKTDYYNCVDKLTEHDLIEDIKYTLDDEMLDEFVTQIKNDSKD